MRLKLVVPLAGGLVGSPLAAQSLTYEGGLSLASGTYIFTERTNSVALSSGIAVRFGPVALRAALPLYLQNTTLVTGSGTGLVPTGGSASEAVADSSAARRGRTRGSLAEANPVPAVTMSPTGALERSEDLVEVPSSSVTGYEMAIGDPTIGVNILFATGNRINASAGAAAKIPVTDTTSVGTGEWDVGALASLSYRVGVTTFFAANVAYWHYGDLPTLELRSSVLGTLGVSYLNLNGWGFSASVYGAASAIEGFRDTYAIGLGGTRISRRGSIGVIASLGLSETAPDFSFGVTWRLTLLPVY
jgi:hypothetical protein